jgi:hypothetical protein
MYPLSGQAGQRRGQSGPLGFLLVFALVIAATTLIVALGAGAIGGTQETLDEERAEKAMTQLDSQAALVALGNSDVQRVDLSTGREGTYQVDDSAGRMTLSYTNQTTGTETTIFSEEMGRIVYESNSGTTIAYQGGGVWRSDGSGNAVMVSPPEFHYRDATLTLPLVTVGSSGTVGDRAVISNVNTTRFFPNTTKNSAYSNPLENARVEISVTSDYYRAWGKYFETRTDGEVEYDHPNNRVTLALVSPLQNTKITSATASLSASGSFEINGKSGNFCGGNYTDSYNSSGTSDDFCAQHANGEIGDEGDIVYGNDVDIGGGAGGSDIRGDVVSGGYVNVANGNGNGQPWVYGNISYSDEPCKNCNGRIIKPGAKKTQISSIDEAPAINGIVRTQVSEAKADNDNSSASFSTNTLTGSVEIGAGTYYLNQIDLASSETVTLNTTEGNIYIGVQEYVHLDTGSTIEVVGDGTVSVYVQGTGSATNDLSLAANSQITNPGDDAPQFRAFGQDNFTALVGDGSGGDLAKYVGVIYAPPGTAGSGTVTLGGGVVYGGVLTGTTYIGGRGFGNGNAGSIHYDEALKTEQVLTQSESIVRVTYIHASTNEVRVEDG